MNGLTDGHQIRANVGTPVSDPARFRSRTTQPGRRPALHRCISTFHPPSSIRYLRGVQFQKITIVGVWLARRLHWAGRQTPEASAAIRN